jgi:hypothetical protein
MMKMTPLICILLFIVGVCVKVSDDVFDEGILSKKFGYVISVCAVPIGTYAIFDAEGFILVGSIFWTTLFRGKIDNPGFRICYCLVATGWAIFFFTRIPFSINMSLLISFTICIFSIIITTLLHDKVKKRGGILWDVLIEERFMMIVLDLPTLLLGSVTIVGIIGLTIMNLGYYFGKRISMNIRKGQAAKNAALIENEQQLSSNRSWDIR